MALNIFLLSGGLIIDSIDVALEGCFAAALRGLGYAAAGIAVFLLAVGIHNRYLLRLLRKRGLIWYGLSLLTVGMAVMAMVKVTLLVAYHNPAIIDRLLSLHVASGGFCLALMLPTFALPALVRMCRATLRLTRRKREALRKEERRVLQQRVYIGQLDAALAKLAGMARMPGKEDEVAETVETISSIIRFSLYEKGKEWVSETAQKEFEAQLKQLEEFVAPA